MAKRSRRRRRTPNVPKYTGPIQQSAEEERPAETRTSLYSGATSAAKSVDYSSEYYYVLTDLRNMLIVSALMLALLLVLNFVV